MNADEQLLKMRKRMEEELRNQDKDNNLENELKMSIFDGSIRIFGKDVLFKRFEIPGMGISLLMPEQFEEVEESLRNIVFPSASRPQLLYADEDNYFNISFTNNTNPVDEEHLPNITKLTKQILEVAGPLKCKVIKTDVIGEEGKKVGVVEFMTQAMDGVAYYVTGLVPMDTYVVMVNIFFYNDRKKRLTSVAKEILQSIEKISPENEE